jgi:hypothetical protein
VDKQVFLVSIIGDCDRQNCLFHFASLNNR